MNSIESQFVPYEISVKLKELGFDWECLAYWHPNEYLLFRENVVWDLPEAPDAPLWQQAFDWFRVEHGLSGEIVYEYSSDVYTCPVRIIKKGNKNVSYDKHRLNFNNFIIYDTYESARLACLEKLIELVTEKKG